MIGRNRGDGLCSGFLQDARAVPRALRPDQRERPGFQPHGVGGGRQIHHHLGVTVPAERECARRADGLCAEAGPERLQPLARVAVCLAVSFPRHQPERLPDDPEGDRRPTEFRTDGKPLQLREAREEANAKAGCRFAADPADQVHAAEIVPIELLVERAGLIADIDDGTDGGGAKKVIDRARDRHPFRETGGHPFSAG